MAAPGGNFTSRNNMPEYSNRNDIRRSTFTNRNEIRKTLSKKYFKNSILIQNKYKTVPFLRNDVLEGIQDLIGGEHIKHLKYVSQHNSYFNWYVTFDEEFLNNQLFDKEITIGKEKVKIEDPFKEYDPVYIYKYRVSWLPHYFDSNDIKKFFNTTNAISINVDEEFERNPKYRHVSNGNFRVTITVKRSNSRYYEEIGGITDIYDFKCLISRLGKPPICLLCGKEGHVKRDCELQKLHCDNCGKNGHASEACNLSRRIDNDFENVVELPDQMDENDEYSETVLNIETENQKLVTPSTEGIKTPSTKGKQKKSSNKKRELNTSDKMDENKNKKDKKNNFESESESHYYEITKAITLLRIIVKMKS